MGSFKFTNSASLEKGDFKSTAVDNVWYNANVNKLAIEWQEDFPVYVYENVTPQEFADLFRGSIGANAARIKKNKGPGTNIGDSDEVRFRKVPTSKNPAAVPQNKRINATTIKAGNIITGTLPAAGTPGQRAFESASAYNTREFSLQPPRVSGSGPKAASTREFSLQTPKAKKGAGLSLVEGTPVFELFFDVDGKTRSHTVRKADDWEDAIDALDNFAASVGLDLKVNQVVITFE